MNKEQLLIAEYTAITDHFRIYQSNRLTIVLVTIPAVGALMINVLDKEFLVQIFSCIMLYLILLFLISIDNIFMKRLRNYTIRLSEIECDFLVVGHASARLKNERNNYETSSKDATTNTIRNVIQVLNIFISFFSFMLIYVHFQNNFSESTILGLPVYLLVYTLPFVILIIFLLLIHKRLRTTNLPLGDECKTLKTERNETTTLESKKTNRAQAKQKGEGK